MDRVSATHATVRTTATTKTPAASTASTSSDFAASLKQAGVKLESVKDHAYARIASGDHKGMYVNSSGNARDGQGFSLVSRDHRTFHVYGAGSDRVVVEVPTMTVKADTTAKTDTGGAAAK